jgi:phosphoglucosamine mutase
MSHTLFGTDGIRANFGDAPLDRETVARVMASWARQLQQFSAVPTVVLGGDTRESTPQLLSWVAGVLQAAGVNTRCAGVVPSPGVAWLVRALDASGGLVVSASHNPYQDNGLKLLDSDGFKLSVESERALELEVAESGPVAFQDLAPEGEPALIERYLEGLIGSLAGQPVDPLTPFAGLRVGLDPGNGAASGLAQKLFEQLGAQVVAICDRPNGRNINDGCGATAPATLARLVRSHGCDLGFAFDGDADRAILVDERGAVRDGDEILYLWARDLEQQGRLEPPAIVATTMSNLGLERALARLGVELVRCPVGDRFVVATLLERGLTLGGEASGHIVDLELATTGDGLLTALQVSAIRARAKQPLSELFADFTRFPQILRNVRVRVKRPFDQLPAVCSVVASIERRLDNRGRLLLRYSGTEPLARIMIEGPDQLEIDALSRELAETLEQELGTAETAAR